jgi:hypothetical protein
MSALANTLDIARRMLLAAASSALGEVPQNSHAWTYTIWGFDKSPYITRTLLPRLGGRRLMLHRIWRADYDKWLHNHPWSRASFLIVSGGYTEERLVDGEVVRFVLKPGDVNHLNASTFHRIVSIEPNTWTLGLIGERVQDWGFLVDGALVPWREYFARQGHEQDKVAS